MIEHRTEVETRDDPRKGLFPGLFQYRAVCSCGATFMWCNYRAQAERIGVAHVNRTPAEIPEAQQ